MKYHLLNENFKEKYVENLLKSRGIDSLETFLNPTEATLSNPLLLDNIDKGAELLIDTIYKGKKILLVVDSDCDGYTSSAIMYIYIKRVKPDLTIDYVLHEGKQHGLEDHIDNLMDNPNGYGLIILPDSSSNDIKFHERLKEVNIPCLVLDHHIIDTDLSDNAIVINNQSSERYLNKELTGAGVAFQFCRYMDMKYGKSYANDLIDLAALGIIGDMGSVITDENRYIIKNGLLNVKNLFFQTIVQKQSYSITKSMTATFADCLKKLNPIAISFYIVPMINAMIRFGTQEEKERLFLAFIDGNKLIPCNKRGAKGTLEKVAIESVRECGNARNHQNKAKEEAVEKLESKIYKNDLLSNKILFVALDKEDTFPAELNGLIAMQLTAEFKKPTIIARLNEEGFLRGSIRGLNDCEFDHFKSYLQGTGMFEYVQGHENAAGCSIHYDNLERFIEKSNKDLAEVNFDEDSYGVNFIRNSSDKDLKTIIEELSKYDNIWGSHNEKPLIYIHDINITQNDIQIMGKNQDAVKFQKFGITYVQPYGAQNLIEELQSFGEMKVEIVGEANLNVWNGTATPQIMIKGYEIKDGSISF